MNDPGKSDRLIVPVKVPNNAAIAAAEVLEGRGLREGNAASKTRPGLRAGQGALSALVRMRRIAGVRGSTPSLRRCFGRGHSRFFFDVQGLGPGGGARRLSIIPTIAHFTIASCVSGRRS